MDTQRTPEQAPGPIGLPRAVETTSAIYRNGLFVFDMFATQNSRMAEGLRLARKAAGNDLTVLITGESGTGKNLLAQAIHNASGRKGGPCLVVNCSALTETLLESELFGHEKGAFTGADALRKGCFELANGGTLVLDEIGDMSRTAQAKILQAVEYRQFMRVGGKELLRTDVRLVAMTNRPLDQMVAEGAFRADLLFRLREIHIELLPLRQRPEDIPMLCELLVGECAAKVGKRLKGVSRAAVGCLQRYAWPGNARELKSVIRRAALAAEHDEIWVEDLGLTIDPQPEAAPAVPDDGADLSLKLAERRHIERILALSGGNKRRASEMLGITRPTLDRKIELYGIDCERFRPAAE